ncbi:MAG: DUF3810 domain-containing protein [Oscillospiraceae bacterium]|jgi:hypothetical protein|nr:DUF3810 domain-containing protein [Oscillospiraceae bacterium]
MPRKSHALRRAILLLIPAALLAAFLLLRNTGAAMDFASKRVSAPARAGLGALTGLIPSVSVAELLLYALLLWLLVHLTVTVVTVIRHSGTRLRILGRRALTLLTVAAWLAGMFVWLWGCNYYARPFNYGSGIYDEPPTAEQLTVAARYFLDGANRTAGNVHRDADGHFDVPVSALLVGTDGLFDGIDPDFPRLPSSNVKAKPIIISRTYSRMGYTGIYLALTGEANVNVDMPRALLPVTIAHELAHSRGVAPEQQADFLAIAACVTGENAAYEYSGYLMGLIRLSNALNVSNPEAYMSLAADYGDLVRRDLTDNYEYWEQFKDDPPIVRAAAETVTAVYDDYLKSNGQELGVRSYGACVDLLSAWVDTRV